MGNPNLHLQSSMKSRSCCESAKIVEDPSSETPSQCGDDQIIPGGAKLSTTRDPIAPASELPEYLEQLLEGSGVCGDSRVAFQKPPWYDDEKFKLGQKLSVDYSFGVVYAHMISLLMIFAFESGLEPLIYSQKSDSPIKAFKRYLSTVVRVRSWSETDIWEEGTEGNTNLKIVRNMHEMVRKSMAGETSEEIERKVRGEGKPRWVDQHREITEGLKTTCPVLGHRLEGPKHVYVSQTDMAVTQFGFVGLILLFPKMFGIHNATEADFEGYAHFWRTVSYLLGVEDKYNLCDGDLETVRRRCREIIDFWVKPRLSTASLDWMHMSRSMCEGVGYYMEVGTSFETVLYYLCDVLEVTTPKLRSVLSFGQLFMFYLTRFLYVYALRLEGVLSYLNFVLKLVIQRGQELSQTPDYMRNLEKIVYPYTKR